MSTVSRRQLLVFFAGSAGAAVLGDAILDGVSSQTIAQTTLTFTPVRLPHPLPIYQQVKSFLPIGIGQGQIMNASGDIKLTSYNVIDDVVVPPEYERYVIVRWGDKIFPNSDEYVGYNCDYTSFIPIGRTADEGYLWVNHEYVSFPFSGLVPETPSDVQGLATAFASVIGRSLPTNRNLELDGEFLYNLGGSIIRISRRNIARRFIVVPDAKNRRLHGLSGLGINSQRNDGYQSITFWGSLSYQIGDQNYLIGTGPAATEVFNISSDGLGNKIIGTAYNCSGGTTPWGTILSAEENFQGGGAFFVGVTEAVRPDGTQTGYTSGTTGATFGLVGEKYGWMVEIDPADTVFRPRKHTWLGRYRHENIALRVEAGKKLVAYLGDDRRGGHTWKFVSSGTVSTISSKSNSSLFESGTLYVAKYNPDGTGQWIPLLLSTPTNPVSPTTLSSVEFAALGSAQRDGLLPLPRRNGIAGQTQDGGAFGCTRSNQATALPGYQNKTLSNFYTSQGAILCDAFLAANLVGGTPTARPEDIEVHPTTKEVFIAYTDGAPGGDGYPDSRIFQVAKLSGAVNATQQSGGIYKIIENSADGTGTTFTWQKLAQGGEAGSISGAGFASVDNLTFDNQGNVWGVTDMSTDTHNGFSTGAAGTQTTINHSLIGNVSTFTGVFGNNWLFYIPTSGVDAGKVIPFAYGPVRCEITGPTFVGDTLIVSVQHPGENCPINDGTVLSRSIELLDLDGTTFNQTRSVQRGSSWPSNIPVADGGKGESTGIPRPCVIGIRRKNSTSRFI
ncbi:MULTISPECIES: PhoX family phosphatase [Nostoc]|uniref:PhoX family phosphatase n=1 Tax=Nostoc paludosum FACHB-159 TaxID=2692908 RepID=A0ABR8K0G2_9NOSO|nr:MULTISPECIES: PhoX family phosphatase [Nostoc]MBD2676567.1 PhoX family phosphatase [Nostoc sp. FACHB-857]MBD2732299.1 PhoX family phosphatase [Nostoc paludosum FACHB-159]